MIVYFIRHGKPEYDRDKSGNLLVYGPAAGLSADGSERVRGIARAIQCRENRTFDLLITSPYRRAEQTTRIIAQDMKIDPGMIIEDDRLRDTDSAWPGEPLEMFLKSWEERRVFDDPHTLETLEQLRARMISAVKEYARPSSVAMIGFVGHGDPLRAWLFPHNEPFISYENLVRSTYESAEGIRAVIGGNGRMETEIIPDFVNDNFLNPVAAQKDLKRK
jgi:broad specificity phosphatase PhoE